jgi:hypothetical protein
MLTGKFPFPALEYENDQQFRLALAKSRAGSPATPSAFRKEVPGNLEAVCLRALRPEIKRRFQSAMEFLAALETVARETKTAESRRACPEAPTLAQDKARKAAELGTQYASLAAAIELLEEAIKEEPALHGQYGRTLARWKSGVVL